MNWLKTHKMWLLSLVIGAVGFFTPSVNSYVAAHPQTATTIGALWGVAAALAKSPLQGGPGSKF